MVLCEADKARLALIPDWLGERCCVVSGIATQPLVLHKSFEEYLFGRKRYGGIGLKKFNEALEHYGFKRQYWGQHKFIDLGLL